MTALSFEYLSSELIKYGICVRCYDAVTSTNTIAKQLASGGAASGTLVIAAAQTAGRGRMGRSFYSPADSGLYMSLILRPELSGERIPYITTLAAVCVCRALETLFPVRAGIKWVNDVYVEGKKVCGILTEGAFRPDGTLDYAVLGIGVNISLPQMGFPEDIRGIAGAVSSAPSSDHTREELCCEIVRSFMELYPRLADAPHLGEYRERSFLIGQDVNVFSPCADAVPARVLNIDDSFALVLRYEDGTVSSVAAGEVSIRTPGAPPPGI